MAKDWLPRERALILEKSAAWLFRLSTEGASRGVPAAVITELHGLTDAARAALDLAVKSERAPVINAQIDAAFQRLREKMRGIKKRRFRSKPNGGYALFPPGHPRFKAGVLDGVYLRLPLRRHAAGQDIRLPRLYR